MNFTEYELVGLGGGGVGVGAETWGGVVSRGMLPGKFWMLITLRRYAGNAFKINK